MKIYTKTGDKGQTKLIGGCLVSKANERIETYGSVDELNALLGLIVSDLTQTDYQKNSLLKMREQLLQIQNELFNIGSLFACDDINTLPKLPQITMVHIEVLEQAIDEMTLELAPLKNFILPGGSRLAALLHMARTTCRRAERNSVKLYEKHPEVEKGMVYLNRLSDYLFTAARFANKHLNTPEQLWSK